MNDDTFTGKDGVELTHVNFLCTCCGIEHHLYIPADNVQGYEDCVCGLMAQGICPFGYGVGQHCSVCDGEVENLESYLEVNGEYLPLFTCSRHQGHYL